jgi:hypothetical protein
VLRARNEVIRRRREIILEHKELPTEEWFTQVLEPLNRRLVSLDKLAFPMETPWRAA